ncbi:MAG: ABC transporter permease [Dehalococcoidia bacterium]|nr:ABC transporter permease [Dehalococcoidia bacterium]
MAEAIVRPVAQARRSRSQVTIFLRRLVREKPLGLIGGVIVLAMLLVALLANVLAPFPYDEIHTIDKLKPPSTTYFLGTDNVGRDLFSRIIFGARISIYVGLGASAINVLISTVVGLLSGYFGGKIDIIVQRFVDALLTFPMLIIVITLMNLFGSGVGQVVIVLGIWGGIGWIRVVRSAVIAIRQNVYIEAARAIGCSTGKMVFRHILPNITPVMIVIFSVAMAGNILGEASLSFLGFGIPPPFPSWGGMLSTDGRSYMYEAPWLAIWPGVALSVTVYGINMWGDAVRDLLDPRLRGGVGRYGGVGGKKVKKTRKK